MTATFGIPDEWRDFERRHQRLLDKVLPPLMDACNQMVSRKMESQGLHDIVVFLFGRHVPEDFTEIMLLCANGYGTAAVRLLRPMYERVVTMMYLIGNPEKAQDFVDWLLVEKRKTLNLLRDEGGDRPNTSRRKNWHRSRPTTSESRPASRRGRTRGAAST